MAFNWDNWFDDDDYDDGWGIQEDSNFWNEDPSYDTWYQDSDWGDESWDAVDDSWYDNLGSTDDWTDVYGDNLDDSWYNNLGTVSGSDVGNRWDTSFGGQANKWTGVGTLLGNLKSGNSSYTNKGSLLGGLFGGKDGVLGGQDIMSLLGSGYGAYMKGRDNDRYNEMMQPMTDLYKAQAADVQSRRDNRDANLASEYNTWEGMMRPDWDRRDQKAANLAQAQGVTQSSSNAWDKAASEQRRDLTKGYQQQQLANAYDQRTGMLGGQLSGMNPLGQPDYLGRQENPYLQMLGQSTFFG